MSIIFTILLLVILIACAASLYTEGMWGNAIRLINVVTAGLIATNYFEPVADWLEEIELEPYFSGPTVDEDETLTESPLDELAAVRPEIDAEAAQELPDPPAEEPLYDVPIVVNDKVRYWLDYYANAHHDKFRVGLIRSGRYVPMFRRIFAEEGLPQDLVYMAHVESAYKTSAYSRARALGCCSISDRPVGGSPALQGSGF